MDDRLHAQLRDVGDAHWWYEGRRRIIRAELEALFAPDPERRILELGCGSGSMLTTLARFGRVDALEPNADAVAHCRSAYGQVATVTEGQVPHDVPSDGTFDLVVAFDVLEHLQDDVGALEAVVRSLHPGGWFVATVPAFPSLWGRQDVLSHHHRRYRSATLSAAAERGGLLVERLTYFNTLLFPPIAGIRLATRLKNAVVRSRSAPAGSDLETGPSGAAATAVLTRVFGAERHLLRRADLPFGVSLLLVTRRPGGEPR